jgi:translation initiation factor IF-2
MNLVSKPVLFAEGTVIEASIDRRQGVVATCLVQHGTLKLGDFVVAGSSWGKVRRLISDQGRDLKDAGPSTPVQVLITQVLLNI